MKTNKKAENLKALQMGNQTYRSALNSSSLLLAKSFSLSLRPYLPKTLCLALDDQVSQTAHLLFNQSQNEFSSLTVTLNESPIDLVTHIETVLSHFSIETLLLLGEDTKKTKKDGENSDEKNLLNLSFMLAKRSSTLALKIKKEEIHLILGLLDSLTGEVKLSTVEDLSIRFLKTQAVVPQEPE